MVEKRSFKDLVLVAMYFFVWSPRYFLNNKFLECLPVFIKIGKNNSRLHGDLYDMGSAEATFPLLTHPALLLSGKGIFHRGMS